MYREISDELIEIRCPIPMCKYSITIQKTKKLRDKDAFDPLFDFTKHLKTHKIEELASTLRTIYLSYIAEQVNMREYLRKRGLPENIWVVLRKLENAMKPT